MARKASRVNGKTGITSSAKSPIERLPINKRRYVQARFEGDVVRDAAAKAGVSRRMGTVYESEADIQAAYRFLMQKAVPAKRLVSLIKGGCEAKTPIYGSDGKKKGERADWKTRRPYIEMAADHAGYHENKAVGGSGNIINLTVTHIGQPHAGAPVNANRNQRQLTITAEAERAS